jgi:hypothetical protein
MHYRNLIPDGKERKSCNTSNYAKNIELNAPPFYASSIVDDDPPILTLSLLTSSLT